MMEKSTRITQLEAMLAEQPADPELRYFLAMEHISAGDEPAGVVKLRALTADSTYVPAFLQAGQVLSRLGQVAEASVILQRGIALARQQGNAHAQGEMQGFLDALE